MIRITEEYPWLEKLAISKKFQPEEIHYAPSLNFANSENNVEFGLTAHYNTNKQPEFSLWYKRPVKTKVFFGLLGEKEKMLVSDVWDYILEDALHYLKYYVDGKYEKLDDFFQSK